MAAKPQQTPTSIHDSVDMIAPYHDFRCLVNEDPCLEQLGTFTILNQPPMSSGMGNFFEVYTVYTNFKLLPQHHSLAPLGVYF